MTCMPCPDHFDRLDTIEATPAFLGWAGTANPILRDEEISLADFQGPGPFVVRGYHSTTHEFRIFDAAVHGTAEGAFGRMHYFTSNLRDATLNYAGVGVDLENRIEHRAENLECEIIADPCAYDLEADTDSSICRALAVQLAQEELVGPTPQVLEVYLRFDRPFLVRGRHAKGRDTTPLVFPGFEDCFAEAEAAVLTEHGIDMNGDEDLLQEARERFEEEIYEEYDTRHGVIYDQIRAAFSNAAGDLGIDAPEVPAKVFEDLSSLTHDQMHRILDQDEDMQCIDHPETGEIVRDDFISRVIARLGFDAIILKEAGDHFQGMSLTPGTAHIHIFDDRKSRIKSIENVGTFDPESPDIFA